MGVKYNEVLVTENLKLVPYLFHRLKRTALTERYSEDIIAEGYIGLIKAARTYDPMKSKFSTYASRCIVNAMRMFIRRANKPFYAEISLETPIGKDDDGGELRLMDILEDERDFFSERETEMDILQFMANCELRDRHIMQLRAVGKKMEEIGQILGYSQSYVSRCLTKLKQAYCFGRENNGIKKNRHKRIKSGQV